MRKLTGVYVVLVTPFTEGRDVDLYGSYKNGSSKNVAVIGPLCGKGEKRLGSNAH